MALQEEFHNYYEHLVIDDINKRYGQQDELRNLLADIACVALNNLPPKYIRFDIDMAYYTSPSERLDREKKLSSAVDFAVEFVKSKHIED